MGAPEKVYFEWKSVATYGDEEVRERFSVVPQVQAQLIVGMLAPATLLNILRDFVVYEPEQSRSSLLRITGSENERRHGVAISFFPFRWVSL